MDSIWALNVECSSSSLWSMVYRFRLIPWLLIPFQSNLILQPVTVYMIMTPGYYLPAQSLAIRQPSLAHTTSSRSSGWFWYFPVNSLTMGFLFLFHSKAPPSNKGKPENKAYSVVSCSPSPATFNPQQPSIFSHHPLIISSLNSLKSPPIWSLSRLSLVQVFIFTQVFWLNPLQIIPHTTAEWSLKIKI